MDAKAKLIINADDFGQDNSLNRVIVDNLSAGKLTSTSIVANGKSFQEACGMAHDNNITNRLGVHLVLDEGYPLSEQMRKFTNSNGEMRFKRKPFIVDRELLTAAYCELSAQIERVIHHGIMPTHLDSHRHCHVSFPIVRVVIALAKEFGIGHIRLARNLACNSSIHARIYKRLYNAYLCSHIGTTDFFTDLLAFYEKVKNGCDVRGSIECMCHLDASERGLRDKEFLESSDFEQFASYYDLIDYSRLI